MTELVQDEEIIRFKQASAIKWLRCATSTRKCVFSSEERAENIAEFAQLLRIDPTAIVFSRQIHSDSIEVIDDKYPLRDIITLNGVDAMVTTLPGVMLTVFTADCVPVFFADATRPIIGIAHCGWRGTLLRLAQKVIRKFADLGSATEDIIVWTGPAICGSCYEISAELVEKFRTEFGDVLFQQEIIQGRKLDLRRLIRVQAIELGVLPENVFITELCTRCRQDLFYSYRGEGKLSGRLLSSIMFEL